MSTQLQKASCQSNPNWRSQPMVGFDQQADCSVVPLDRYQRDCFGPVLDCLPIARPMPAAKGPLGRMQDLPNRLANLSDFVYLVLKAYPNPSQNRSALFSRTTCSGIDTTAEFQRPTFPVRARSRSRRQSLLLSQSRLPVFCHRRCRTSEYRKRRTSTAGTGCWCSQRVRRRKISR